MKARIGILILGLWACCAWAQEPVKVDISEVCPGVTNPLLLWPATNDLSPSSWLVSTTGWAYVYDKFIAVTSHYDAVQCMIKTGTLTNTVQRLVKEGHVCAVIGHRWQDGCGVLGCLVLHSNNQRHCVICGKTQGQKVGDWE